MEIVQTIFTIATIIIVITVIFTAVYSHLIQQKRSFFGVEDPVAFKLGLQSKAQVGCCIYRTFRYLGLEAVSVVYFRR